MRLAWGQSCPEGMITSWAKQCDRKVQGGRTGEEMMERLQCLVASHSLCHLRGHMPANSLQIHSEICSGSCSIILPNMIFQSQTWHSFSYCFIQINLDWVGGGNERWRGRVLNVCNTRGVIFGANCATFYSTCLPSHLEPRSEEQHFSPHQRAFP